MRYDNTVLTGADPVLHPDRGWDGIMNDEILCSTREFLLLETYDEMRENGYRGASLNRIAERAGLTKGSLYHYFPSKTHLGCAVIDEVIGARIRRDWLDSLQRAGNPIVALQRSIRREIKQFSLDLRERRLNSLHFLIEMSYLDDRLQKRYVALQTHWLREMERALRRGVTTGLLRPDIQPRRISLLLLTTLLGAATVALIAGDARLFRNQMNEVSDRLRGLLA